MTQVRQREAQRIFEAPVARYQMYTDYLKVSTGWLDQVPANWYVIKLKYIADMQGGGTPSKNEPDFWNGDIPWVSPKDMKAEWIDDAEDKITELGLKESATSLIPPQSVLIVVRSGILKHSLPVAINTIPVALNQDMKALHPSPSVIPEFLAWMLRGTSADILALCHHLGATVDSLRTDFLSNMLFPVPPIDEQPAIAAFLDRQTAKIDALIAKKRQLITALHEKRSAIISHAVTKGLNPDAPMKESGIEWVDSIPAHWQVQRLKFVADVRSGVAKGRKFEGVKTVELPYLRVANVQAGHIDLSDVAEIEVTVSEIERYSLKVGDVLMNEGGDYDKLGRGAVWKGQIEPCLHQNHVFAVRPYQQSLSLWITTLTLAQYARFYFMINSKQSTNLASISSRNLSEFPVIMPPQSEREQILGYIEDETRHIDRLTAKGEETIERLQEYRAALISAAVTGKIDVRGA